MTVLQPAILGLVQGLTEFLPISSSGHLVIIRDIFQWPDQGPLFDAVLQLASVAALLVYFRIEVGLMIRSLNPKLTTHTVRQSRRLLGLLAISTIPVVVAGLLFPNLYENIARGLLPVAGMMIFVGLLFIVVERVTSDHRGLSKLTFFDALATGIAQMAALLPGVSRSGASIATGLYLGLKREDATRYAFLMGIPALALAGGYALLQLEFGKTAVEWSTLGLGFAVAFLSSLAAISFMMRWFKHHKLFVFAGYRIVIGIGLIIWYFLHA